MQSPSLSRLLQAAAMATAAGVSRAGSAAAKSGCHSRSPALMIGSSGVFGPSLLVASSVSRCSASRGRRSLVAAAKTAPCLLQRIAFAAQSRRTVVSSAALSRGSLSAICAASAHDEKLRSCQFLEAARLAEKRTANDSSAALAEQEAAATTTTPTTTAAAAALLLLLRRSADDATQATEAAASSFAFSLQTRAKQHTQTQLAARKPTHAASPLSCLNWPPPLSFCSAAVRRLSCCASSALLLNVGASSEQSMLLHRRRSRRCLATAAEQQEETQPELLHSVKIPSLGDSITEGSILEWKKKVGDYVQIDEVLCVIETDKVTVEIHSDCEGTVVSHAAAEGAALNVGDELAVIRLQDEVAAHSLDFDSHHPELLHPEQKQQLQQQQQQRMEPEHALPQQPPLVHELHREGALHSCVQAENVEESKAAAAAQVAGAAGTSGGCCGRKARICFRFGSKGSRARHHSRASTTAETDDTHLPPPRKELQQRQLQHGEAADRDHDDALFDEDPLLK